MSQLGPAVIAELKKASPSRGVLRGNFNVETLACQLARAGGHENQSPHCCAVEAAGARYRACCDFGSALSTLPIL